MTTPQPLPAHSNLLRLRRVVAWVGGAKSERTGGRPQWAEGRFRTDADARAWADAEWPAAPYVLVTFYAARDGWRPRLGAERIGGIWIERERI